VLDLLILDLDNTIYPRESGLFTAVDGRITLFMSEVLGLAEAEADALRRRYRDEYHLTLIGLMRHQGVDPTLYLDFVHDLRIPEFLSPDPELDALLGSLGLPVIILTNGSREYAGRVLAALGVSGRIREIIGIEETGYIPKPHPDGYRRVLAATGAAPDRALFVDDMERNLAGAKELGLRTGLVHPVKAFLPHPWDFASADVKTLLREVAGHLLPRR
jgi:putative hydrolase of the HAD superfamily